VKRRAFLRTVGLGAASLAAGCARATGRPAGADRPPNLILLMADDCSAREFGCYGHREHRTPVLDRLAETGVRFRTCWCTPICSPTRAMLMTGQYAFRTRWWHNQMKPGPKEPHGDLSREHTLFAQPLRQAGYATAICGKWQLRGQEDAYGFDEHCMWKKWDGFDGPVEKEGHALPGRAARYWHPAIVRNGQGVKTTATDYGPDLFADFLLDFARRHRDRPFLIYYPMCLTHGSWDFEAGRRGHLPVPELDADGRPTGRKRPGSLRHDVEYTDALVGRIVKGLEALGLRQNTVLMFTCDNGTAVYGKNKVAGERGPLVPMIANGPGRVRPRGARDELVSLVDVFPTLLDLAGVAPPEGYTLDGRSFAWILRGEPGEEREYVFSYCADARLIRTKRWLLDGDGRLWDCGDNRSGEGYADVTDSKDAEVLAARKRLEGYLEHLPGPAPDDPLLARYRSTRAREKKQRPSRSQPEAKRRGAKTSP